MNQNDIETDCEKHITGKQTTKSAEILNRKKTYGAHGTFSL